MPKWKKVYTGAVNFFEERGIESAETFARSRLHRFAHFWLLVGKSFIRNRCPVRAASLAYTTLLALVPLLAVCVSITTSILQKDGEKPVQELISKLVGYIAPALDLQARPTNQPVALDTNAPLAMLTNALTNPLALANTNSTASATNAPASNGRDDVVKRITAFIANINTGTLGAASAIALLFVGISLLRTIEATLNDIWGVTRGRGWIKSIAYYWLTISLGPIFLVGAITLTTGPHLESSRAWIERVPLLGSVVFHVLPFVILSFGFAALYALLPNTKVHFAAALAGGIVGGCLWQLNNLFSVIYVARVLTYANIYGSLGVFPLFLMGLYLSWLIMLLGAQVAYAFQNREAYIQTKQAESVSQRGREFIALRLMTRIAQNFARGGRPFSVLELAKHLGVPSQLAQKILGALATGGLLVEVMDTEARFSPGRPLDRITAYDILSALRAGNGQELTTTDDEARQLVRAEFDRMIVAERDAGAGVTLQSLTELAAKQIGNGTRTGQDISGVFGMTKG